VGTKVDALWRGSEEPVTLSCGLAVTGIGVHVGQLTTGDRFEKALFDGGVVGQPAPTRVGAGDEATVGVAVEALRDAGLVGGEVAVVVVAATTTAPTAEDLAARCQLAGPARTVTAGQAGVVTALVTANDLLAEPAVAGVLIVAVGAADVAGAVVVCRQGEPGRGGYVRLDAVGLCYPEAPGSGLVGTGGVAASLTGAARAAIAAAGIRAADVEYLDAVGGAGEGWPAEVAALAKVYPAGDTSVAWGGAATTRGPGVANPAELMLGLIRTVLCLRHGYLPGTAGWRGPEADLAEVLATSGLYVPDTSRPWLRSRIHGRRHAAVVCADPGGARGQLVLSAASTASAWGRATPVAWRRAGGPVVLPIAAEHAEGLLAAIEEYRDRLDGDVDGFALARQASLRLPGRGLRLVVIGQDPVALRYQLELAASDLPKVLAEGGEWSTPAGSYFTAHPIGPEGKVALVYPGAFSSYPGLGRDLFRAVPGLLDQYEESTDQPARSFRQAALYPRTQSFLDQRELMTREAQLRADIPTMFMSGISLGYLLTDLVRDVLRVPVHGGLGYSLGEFSMLFASGALQNAGRGDELIADALVLRERLGGSYQTVRELWQIPADVADAEVWASFVLLTSERELRAVGQRYDRVYLTQINSPDELVIAGDPAQCRALIAEVGCLSSRAPGGLVMHCPVVDPEIAALSRLSDFPPGDAGDLELFSGYDYAPMPRLERRRLSERVTSTMRAPFDFPRLIRAAYRRGFRYFIEVGPGAACSRWVHDTLGQSPHVASPTDRRGVSAATTIARLSARLISHGVPVDLSTLVGQDRETPTPWTEDHDMAPAGISADPDEIGFHGDSEPFLPWSAPAAGAPDPTSTAAGIVHELREQVLATHAGVMATHRLMQSIVLDRTEARLTSVLPAPTRPEPARSAGPVSARGPGAGPARARRRVGGCKPLAYTEKNFLTGVDLATLAAGRPGEVFGSSHAQDRGVNSRLLLADGEPVLLDEVSIDSLGGRNGLGTISARLGTDLDQLTPPATDLLVAGAAQALRVYLLHQGMHLTLPDAGFQLVGEPSTTVDTPAGTSAGGGIRYDVEVTRLTLLPRPTVTATVRVSRGAQPLLRIDDLGVRVAEHPGSPYRQGPGGVGAFLGRRSARGEPMLLTELHLAHAARGDLGIAMGPEFDVYRDSRAPYIPNGDLQFVDRVVSVTGTRGDLKPGAEMVCEYDSPADAWYYQENSYPHMPNLVYMETSLQAAIFLGYYLGATLDQPKECYSIRNLDGRATLIKDIDLRGKTIRHHSTLLMTCAVTGAVLQNFSYELSADGEVFYTGESLFGYFSASALANQVGLDNGQYAPPWIEATLVAPDPIRRGELPRSSTIDDHLRVPGGRFHLVDQVELVVGGGRHGAGYLHGRHAVRPDEWYFDCHFHRDPVMPGSLGVEAVLQALRWFVLDQGLADGLEQPRFAMATGVEMSWKYRGQILRCDGEMRFDVHIKEIRRKTDVVLVIADADLWKPGLRIYELKDVALEVRSASTGY
jgi:PfaB family protein